MSTIKLAAARWEMEIKPERGGRITSLRLDGEELLDQGIGIDQPTADGFVEGGAFGWDEMVPNLEPTDFLPDHGEAWRLPWEVVARSPNSVGVQCEGRLIPWRLGRRVFLGSSVVAHYNYTNVGSRPHHAFWCAHPLFKYEPVLGLDLAEGTSTKLFMRQASVDRVRLRRVEVSWDPLLSPEVAIWLCNGDLGGYRQIAIEPSWTRESFPPGETYSWWLEVTPI